MLFLAGATFAVLWGLFVLALLSGPVTGEHDTSFIVISLIYALVMTPAAFCILGAARDDRSYAWAEDDNGQSGPGT